MATVILIVEDEPDLARLLAHHGRQEGYEVRVAGTAREALREVVREPRPGAILLDWMLPDQPGTEVCRQMRADPFHRNTPIIMVTARNEEIDRVVAFEIGADDVVIKPFSVRELFLRLRAILRRGQATPTPRPTLTATTPSTRIVVDKDAHRAYAHGVELVLTPTEFSLLQCLMEAPGKAFSREKLVDVIWTHQKDVTARAVDTHIKRLRRKLGPASECLETVRGVGYRLVLDTPAPPIR